MQREGRPLRPAVFRPEKFEVERPVAEEVEQVNQPVAVVVNQLSERHVLHGQRCGFRISAAHILDREFPTPFPAVVRREERRHTRLVPERAEDETVKIEQVHIVHHLVIADEMIVFVAQHAELEYH